MPQEIEKHIITSLGQLKGTLCLPETDINHVALILAGSGALDRNGNGIGLQLNLYNAMAHQLAASGIASFRYDKRGCGHSDGEHLHTGYFDLVSDARDCLRAMNQFEEISNRNITLIAHSEGTLISSTLSADNPAVSRQVLIAPFLDPLETVIENQIRQTVDQVKNLGGLKGFISSIMLRISGDQIKKQRNIMRQIRHSKADTITIKKNEINAKWLRDHQSIDPRQIHQQCKTPTLSIGCAKDLQCPPEDAQSIAGVINAAVDVRILDNLTHILRTDSEPPSTFRYRELSAQPIDERVCNTIVDWLNT